jgi:opacity protein-like surface antigen
MTPIGRAAVAIAAAALATASDGSHAADEYEFTWRLAGGASFPVHSELLSDLHTSGINLEVGVGAMLPLGFRLYGTYDYNTLFADEEAATQYVESQEDPSFDTSNTVDANPTRIHTVMAWAFLPVTKNVAAKPYVVGGIGWMWVRTGDITYTGGTLGGGEESAFATALGGGVDFRAGPTINVFVEAVWYVGFTDDNTTQIVPLRVGVYR